MWQAYCFEQVKVVRGNKKEDDFVLMFLKTEGTRTLVLNL